MNRTLQYMIMIPMLASAALAGCKRELQPDNAYGPQQAKVDYLLRNQSNGFKEDCEADHGPSYNGVKDSLLYKRKADRNTRLIEIGCPAPTDPKGFGCEDWLCAEDPSKGPNIRRVLKSVRKACICDQLKLDDAFEADTGKRDF